MDKSMPFLHNYTIKLHNYTDIEKKMQLEMEKISYKIVLLISKHSNPAPFLDILCSFFKLL